MTNNSPMLSIVIGTTELEPVIEGCLARLIPQAMARSVEIIVGYRDP